MPLKQIVWNALYRAQPQKRIFAENRIRVHYQRRGLEAFGVEIANVAYVPKYSFNASPLLTIYSPIGWHGESGPAKSGGHLTVCFLKADGSHFTTHHVYCR